MFQKNKLFSYFLWYSCNIHMQQWMLGNLYMLLANLKSLFDRVTRRQVSAPKKTDKRKQQSCWCHTSTKVVSRKDKSEGRYIWYIWVFYKHSPARGQAPCPPLHASAATPLPPGMCQLACSRPVCHSNRWAQVLCKGVWMSTGCRALV